MMIPKTAFEEIIKELETHPLQENKYRLQSGSGRSQAFLVVNRRCLAPDYSRQCWLRPYLLKLLLDFGKQYVTDISWNAITVNQNYKADKHYDKHNLGPSFLVAFGDYTGGELLIHEGDLSGNHNINCNPVITDFSKVLHSVSDFEGERYSLVYYNFHTKRSVPLPPASVREEDGKWVFYRGEERIGKKEGLPHPLKGRKKTEEVNLFSIERRPEGYRVEFS
jgi:hypothetical protein